MSEARLMLGSKMCLFFNARPIPCARTIIATTLCASLHQSQIARNRSWAMPMLSCSALAAPFCEGRE